MFMFIGLMLSTVYSGWLQQLKVFHPMFQSNILDDYDSLTPQKKRYYDILRLG